MGVAGLSSSSTVRGCSGRVGGGVGVNELTVELVLKVAQALERFAAAYNVPVDALVEVWFLE